MIYGGLDCEHWTLTAVPLCSQLTFSEPLALGAATPSEFEAEPVQGRKVSKVVKTTVVRGERLEKQTGETSLAADLPSAREDFERVSLPLHKSYTLPLLSSCCLVQSVGVYYL